MSTELVNVENELEGAEDRQRALAELNHVAERATTPSEAREVMVKAKSLSVLLEQIKAPFDDARLAGKASVVAARRLGRLLLELSGEPVRLRGDGRTGLNGWQRSERRTAVDELGITPNTSQNFIKLARVEDAEFQRYIQRGDLIPSLNGALIACRIHSERHDQRPSGWRGQRRVRAGVKAEPNPSLDEAYSLIVKALGHAGALAAGGSRAKKRAVRDAIDHLYAAEDLIRPFVGGYVA